MNSPLPSQTNSAVRARGFTLIELLVVIAIIGVLASLLFPAVQGVKMRANKAASASNLKQIGVAMFAYAQDTDGYLPPSKGYLKDGAGPGNQYWWAVHLMPYVGNSVKVFDRPGTTATWSDPYAVDPRTQKAIRIGYWINAGDDPFIAFQHGPAVIDNLLQGKNYKPTLGFDSMSRTVLLADGIGGNSDNGWNPDSRGNWRSGENSKLYRWTSKRTDANGLASDGKPPKGDYNVLWLDGHVSLESPASLKESDFLRIKP